MGFRTIGSVQTGSSQLGPVAPQSLLRPFPTLCTSFVQLQAARGATVGGEMLWRDCIWLSKLFSNDEKLFTGIFVDTLTLHPEICDLRWHSLKLQFRDVEVDSPLSCALLLLLLLNSSIVLCRGRLRTWQVRRICTVAPKNAPEPPVRVCCACSRNRRFRVDAWSWSRARLGEAGRYTCWLDSWAPKLQSWVHRRP